MTHPSSLLIGKVCCWNENEWCGQYRRYSTFIWDYRPPIFASEWDREVRKKQDFPRFLVLDAEKLASQVYYKVLLGNGEVVWLFLDHDDDILLDTSIQLS